MADPRNDLRQSTLSSARPARSVARVGPSATPGPRRSIPGFDYPTQARCAGHRADISIGDQSRVTRSSGFKTTYRVVETDAHQGPVLARYAATTMKLKSVAIVDDATAYGQGLADEFEKTAKSSGMVVLSRDATNDKAVDFPLDPDEDQRRKPGCDHVWRCGRDGRTAREAGEATRLACEDFGR